MLTVTDAQERRWFNNPVHGVS